MSGSTLVLHRPADVARMLGCSEWWVKEQARKRRIPFAWIGGSYRFTDEHVAAIIARFEVRPDDAPVSASAPRRAARRSGSEHHGATVIQLKARIPRRTRTTTTDQAAA